MRQDGKVVLVTGAGSGMGRAMVHQFVAEGARVAAVGRTADKIQATVAELADPSRARAFRADVSDESAVEGCVAAVLDWAGRVDVLCNNAGVLDTYNPAHEVTMDEWNQTVAVNMTGPFLMSRAVLPTMLQQGKGAIIITASTSAFSAAGGGVAYTAAKHGALGLTRQLTFEYGKRGIRVNAICPGATRTPMAMGDSEATPDMDAAIAQTPAGRWCEPEEIAKLAAFLASDDADFVHGSAYVIDGGWLTAARDPF